MATQAVSEPLTDAQAIHQQKIKELVARGYTPEQAEKAAPYTTCGDLTVTPSYQAMKKANDSRAPQRTTLSELEEEAYITGDNLGHYTHAKIEAEADVQRLEDAEKAALETLKELDGVTGVEARTDREKAKEILERVRTFRLPQAKRRLENILIQLKSWKKRESEFDWELYKKLKAEAKRRRRLAF